ncbi:MAG: N-acetylmuramoyl-L-alanine amidase [Saprospiraceae bacterium]|nr:N-acetylmuramoyl-L-alanine amidase [Saprospiraceae bacterium]MCB9322177.1 N-acetylmuramoyl-L-alanine amidase [Lewinellaceae bacterium]
MFKTAFLIQTVLLSFLAAPAVDFNVSLSFPSHLLQNSSPKIKNDSPIITLSGHKANDLTLNNLPLETNSLSLEKINPLPGIKISSSGIKTVVIDPGHGGHDPGCLGKKSHEKTIALSIAKKLADAIKKDYPQVKVILTRDSDVFIPLHKRAAIANRNNADLFISIHCNSMPPGNGKTNGTETYVMGLHTAQHNLDVAKRENAAILLEADYEKNYDYDPNSPEGHILLSMFQNAFLEQSIQFATKVEQQFSVVTNRNSRGVKQAGFVVLKETTMPSVLIETGFLSNTREENYLYTDQGQDQVAEAILKAFSDYKKEIESSVENGLPYEVVEVKTPTVEVSAPQMDKSGIQTNKTGNEVYYTINASPSYEYNPPARQEKSAADQGTSKELNAQEIFRNQEPETSYATYPGLDYNARRPSAYTVPETYSKRDSREAVTAKSGIAPKEGVIDFRVQLAASPYPLNTSSSPWQNTGYLIEIIQENNLYKYQARNFSTYTQALEAKMDLRSKGFSDAFMVAYQKGSRITIDEAKKQLGIQ